MAELIVITGGSYSGKTAIIEALAARGHAVIHEAAYEVIAEMNEIHGVEGQVRWREGNLPEFQRLLGLRQHARETAARASAAGLVFCDRGFLDGLAYCRHAGVEWPEELHALARGVDYAHVFLLETLAGFDPRRTTGRSASHEDSLAIATLIESIYRERAFDVSVLGEAPIETRVERILRTLGADGRRQVGS